MNDSNEFNRASIHIFFFFLFYNASANPTLFFCLFIIILLKSFCFVFVLFFILYNMIFGKRESCLRTTCLMKFTSVNVKYINIKIKSTVSLLYIYILYSHDIDLMRASDPLLQNTSFIYSLLTCKFL